MIEEVEVEDRPPVQVLVALCALVYLPFTLLGYGTDIDVANVLRAGRSILSDEGYHISRGPGAFVHEAGTAALDWLGGSVLVNVGSVGFASLVLWSVYKLIERDGGAWPDGALVVLAANPWFWIAATSLGDFVWALGLLLAGAVAAQRDRRILAGVAFGLAVGCRGSTVLLVIAWLLAERLGTAASADRARATRATAGVALVVGALCFVPPWLDAGRTLAFLDNELEFVGMVPHFGRWLVKNAAILGLPAGVVVIAGLRQVASVRSRWQISTVTRFAVIGGVLSEVLFFRFPFKPLHLLPVVAAGSLLVGSAPNVSRRWLAALIVAQLVGGIVGTTVAAPDTKDAARSGRLDIGVRAGPLLTNVRCRMDDGDHGPWVDPSSGPATRRAIFNADCQSRSWRAD